MSEVSSTQPMMSVKDVKMHFPIHGGFLSRVVGQVKAVDGVSFDLYPGETLGLVGESGCGKSTLGRTLLKLYRATSGKIEFEGKDLTEISGPELKTVRRDMQMIFQDPFSSLDPRMSVERLVTEPLRLHQVGTSTEQVEKAGELLELVGLKREDLKKYPHEFSGGQRQRIGIARALALNPKLIVADEPIAALDVSIQAQVLNLMSELKKKFQLTYLFISHDLSVVKYFSDRVAVMYLGKIVELTTSDKIYENPLHPYTKALMSAILHADPEKKTKHEVLQGDVPSPIDPPSGCAFHTRCRFARDECKEKTPELIDYDQVGHPTDNEAGHQKNNREHWVSCHFVKEIN